MKKIKIGFIGGCLNNQEGIGKNDIYYSIISKNLNKNNINNQIFLGSYLYYSQLEIDVKKHIERKRPNIIYLFIRPFPLMVLNKPFVKYVKNKNKKTYSLHPQLFLRKMKWEKRLNSEQNIIASQIKRKKIFNIQDVNILIGFILGLHRWSLKYIGSKLILINSMCKENNIRLVLILPPKYRKSALSNYISKSTNKYISKKINIPNINIFDINHFEVDKIHLNKYGHKILGKRISENIINTFANII